MINWLFYQQYHFANGCSQGRKKNVFANDRIVFVAGRAQAVRVDNGSMLFLYSIIRSQRTKAKKGVFSVLSCFASDYYFGCLCRQINPMTEPCENDARYLALPSRSVYLWRDQGAKGDFCPGEQGSSRCLTLYFEPWFLLRSIWRGYCNLVYNCSSYMWD